MQLPNPTDTFYGLKFDAKTGRLTAETINDGTPIVERDYKASFYSPFLITFKNATNGHLQAIIL